MAICPFEAMETWNPWSSKYRLTSTVTWKLSSTIKIFFLEVSIFLIESLGRIFTPHRDRQAPGWALTYDSPLPFKYFEFIAHFYPNGNIEILSLKGVLLPHYFSAFSGKAFREKFALQKFWAREDKSFPGMVKGVENIFPFFTER
jgi:hypothetical protein